MPNDSRSTGNRDRNDGRASSSRKREARPSWREGLQSQPPRRDTPIQPDRSTDNGDQVGHKWRDMQQQTNSERELPPLPGQRNSRASKSGTGSMAIIFGAILLAIVIAMLILPFSPLVSEDDPDLTATPAWAQATTASNDTVAANATEAPTHAPAETVESDFLVCIDPGHGGWDYGRERMDKSQFGPPWFFESEITLSMSLHLRDELESRDIAVILTRETGGAVNWRNDDVNGDGQVLDDTPEGLIAGMRDELQARINICNDSGADIMISIHLNGFDDQSVGGYEIFYNSQREFATQNQDLAVFLYREMSVAFADLEYAAAARGTTDDLNLSANLHEYGAEQFLIMIGPEVRKPEYTIVPTSMPGVVIETLFVSNTNDANAILNPINQQRLAVGWADGIENYRERYGDNTP